MLQESPILSHGMRVDHFLDKRDTQIFTDSLVGDIPGGVNYGAKPLLLKPLYTFLSDRLGTSPEQQAIAPYWLQYTVKKLNFLLTGELLIFFLIARTSYLYFKLSWFRLATMCLFHVIYCSRQRSKYLSLVLTTTVELLRVTGRRGEDFIMNVTCADLLRFTLFLHLRSQMLNKLK